MALLLMDGFDSYAPSGTLWNDANMVMAMARNWDVRSTNNTGALTPIATGRAGGLAFYAYGDNSYYGYIQRTLAAPAATIILGCSWQAPNTTGNVNFPIFTLLDSAGTEMGRVYLTASGGQLVYRNGSGTTILTTSFTGGFSLNVWYTLEVKVTAGTTTGYVEIRINGGTVGSASSVNTVGAALTTGAQTLAIGPRAVATANFNTEYVDHLIVMDNTGATLNDFQGDRRIVTLTPFGPGTYSQWTPSVTAAQNWEPVSEAKLDQDTTYNATSTAGNLDSYDLSNLPLASVPVYAVQVSAHVRQDDTGRQARLLLRTNNSDQLVSPATSLNSDYSTRLSALLAQNPATSAAWMAGDINALEAGIQLTA